MARPAAVAAAGALVVLGGCGGGSSKPPPTPAAARACLTKHDFRVTSGGRSRDDGSGPDTELIVLGSQASAFLAFYADTAHADRYAPQIASRAKRVNVTLERHRALTILWIRGKHTDAGDAIRDCAV